MPTFSDAYLNQLIAYQEIELSRRTRSIYHRFELAITANQSIYVLPDQVESIVEVSWQGEYLNKVTRDEMGGNNWYQPNNLANAVEKPWSYLINSYGYSTIQFHPKPSVAIPLTNGNLNTRTGFMAAVVVSAYCVADTSGDLFRLRVRLLRNCIKFRAMERAYMREGRGQDLIAAAHFKTKADWVEAQFLQVYQQIPKAVISDNSSDSWSSSRQLARPHLPTTGPWSF